MQWFRLFVEARNDAKLRSLTDAQFRVWFNLLCYAAEQSERGRIEATDAHLLALEVSGGDVQLLDETCNRLQALHVVSCVSPDVSSRFIAFLNFEKRNAKSVSRNKRTSTDRVRKHREAKKLRHDETRNAYETLMKPDETLLARAREEEIRLEENREELQQQPAGASESLNSEAAQAVESARARHGDRVAAFVASHAEVIATETDGRWDQFLEALDAASIQEPPVRSVLPWCLARVKGRGRNPPAVANGRPHGSRATERSRRQQDAFEKALADIPEDF